MKIKTKLADYETIKNLEIDNSKRPRKPLWLIGLLIYILGLPELLAVKFSAKKIRMEKVKGPCLILMNHSCFLDMKIAYKLFFPKRLSVVCTTDAYIGKSLLMRLMGCIPTNKFVTDISLISHISHALKKNKANVLMYPEAGYSFDGTATALPPRIGVLIKKLDVPVVTVITKGAFLRDPLYNGLRKRKTKVTATVKCLLTPEEIKEKSSKEITALLNEEFTFDAFKEQQNDKTEINENFRAEGLERILYRCPNCQSENTLKGEGSVISCSVCGKEYELETSGYMKAKSGDTEFSHIPDWYNWERQCVKEEILKGEYLLDTDVEIGVICDTKCLYMLGDGHLTHTIDGFRLIGCNGQLDYTQSPLSSYSLNADYYWYEISDIICIGDASKLYYCFPKTPISVAKARLATEEIYKIKKEKKEKI